MAATLDIEHLRTLIAIAECGGFSKAAAARHISQPALSQHVRILERDLKRKLFERDGRRMRFTAEGDRVLAEARRIIEVHDQALARLAAEADNVVVIGSTEHTADQLLPQMLHALRESLPDVVARFTIARSTHLASLVERGSTDLAFVLDPRGNGAGTLIADLDLIWYAAPGWQLPQPGGPISLVAFEEPCAMRERATRLLTDQGYRVEVTAQSSTLEGVMAGVRAGLGTALLPSSGGRPAGLSVRHDLPDAGAAALRLIARRGLDESLLAAAAAAGTQFFRSRPHLRLTNPDQPAAVGH